MGFEWLPTGPCPVLPTTRPLHGSRTMKIERQLNQRINSINLEPIRWYFRIVHIFSAYRAWEAETAIACLCDGNLRFDSADWSLAISEHGLLRMPLGQRSRGVGITEVLRPLPVPDLGHVLEVLADIVVVALQFLVEEVDGAVGCQT